MRALTGICVILICTAVHASQVEYFAYRKLVEQLCTNAIPQGERVFVAGPEKYAAIIQFHKGMSLRELIDQTPFKRKRVIVHVSRAERRTSNEYLSVWPSERPHYELKDLDLIILYKDGEAIINP
jgi:hypothetical protein